jgi:hypothetical protein
MRVSFSKMRKTGEMVINDFALMLQLMRIEHWVS